MKLSPNIEFLCNSVRNEEDRTIKAKDTVSYSVSFIDNKKKNQSEKDWTPISQCYFNVIGDITTGFEVGKKYKVTFEEID